MNVADIVIIHGVLANAAQWDNVRKPLEAKGHRVIVANRRGRDGIPIGADYRVETEIGDANRLLDSVGPGAVLFGHSYGAVIALLIFKMEFSIIALIGVFLLIGIVKKNAILIIDFALEAQRSRGLTAVEAVREACLLRFRPILMTTLAAGLGALPLAIGFGEGSELRQPLGVAIIGGLIASQLLTLLTTPVVYIYLDRLRPRRRDERFLSRLSGPQPGPAPAE